MGKSSAQRIALAYSTVKSSDCNLDPCYHRRLYWSYDIRKRYYNVSAGGGKRIHFENMK